MTIGDDVTHELTTHTASIRGSWRGKGKDQTNLFESSTALAQRLLLSIVQRRSVQDIVRMRWLWTGWHAVLRCDIHGHSVPWTGLVPHGDLVTPRGKALAAVYRDLLYLGQ